MPKKFNYNKELNFVLKKTKKRQMTKEEYEYISTFCGSVNFLIFGTGFDSNFWRGCNKKGFNVFLEHDKRWIKDTDNDVYHINYTSSISDSDRLYKEFQKGIYDNFTIEYPNLLNNVKWDCILVDGPPGNTRKSIGRMQSLFLAKKLATKKTNIFVHDIDREIEKLFSSLFFSKCVKTLTKLQHRKL